MNIFIILKCGLKDSFNFISQIAEIDNVGKVVVFRDKEGINAPGIEYITLKSKWNGYLVQILRFFQVIKARKYLPKMIIGIYEIPHGFIAVLAGKIMGVPSTVSVIGNPAYSKLRKGLRMKITMWILRNANYITVTGTNSKKFLVSKGIARDKIKVLPNTLDLSEFKKLNSVNKKYDIISLGRISPEKRIEQIVKIVYKMKERMPTVKAAIAGTGPELPVICELISKLKLDGNIEILGYIPDNQLVDFYNSGRVFVLTSETEGFPRTILQAAACGTPVIASKVGDIDDIIDHGSNGFLINNFMQVEEYVHGILQLLKDDNLYASFSIKLSEKVHTEFVTGKASAVWANMLNE